MCVYSLGEDNIEVFGKLLELSDLEELHKMERSSL